MQRAPSVSDVGGGAGFSGLGWGVPRTTFGLDFDVDLSEHELSQLLAGADRAGFLVDVAYVRGLTERVGGMYPMVVIKKWVGGRAVHVDLFLAQTPFLRGVFDRAVSVGYKIDLGRASRSRPYAATGPKPREARMRNGLLAVLLAIGVRSGSVCADDARIERLPLLRLAAASQRDDGTLGATTDAFRVIVGRLPKGAADDWNAARTVERDARASGWPDVFNSESDRPWLATDLVAGKLVLLPPVAGEPVAVALVGPLVSDVTGQWGPVEIQRRGRTITVLVESWTDNAPMRAEQRRRFVHLLSLGSHPPVGFDLVVVQRLLFRDESRRDDRYAERTAPPPYPLAVPPKPDVVPTAHVPCAGTDDPTSLPVHQMPRCAIRSNRGSTGKVSIGDYDDKAWLLAKEAARADPPPVGGRHGPHAYVVGPALHRFDAMSLRRVTWSGRQARLAIDVWRHPPPGGGAPPSRPALIAPLAPPARAASQIEVVVDWTVWTAKVPGGVATADDAARTALAAETSWRTGVPGPPSAFAPLGPVVRSVDDGMARFLAGATAADAFRNWVVVEPAATLRDDLTRAGVTSAHCFTIELELLFSKADRAIYYLHTLAMADETSPALLAITGRPRDGQHRNPGHPQAAFTHQLTPFGEAGRAVLEACKRDRTLLRPADPEAVKAVVGFAPAHKRLLDDLATLAATRDSTCGAVSALDADRVQLRIDELSIVARDKRGADVGVIRARWAVRAEGKLELSLTEWVPWR